MAALDAELRKLGVRIDVEGDDTLSWDGPERQAGGRETFRQRQAACRLRRIRIVQPQENTAFRFADTGPGIDEVALQRLMEPYFTTKSSGTGLGLLIVDRIVRAHGGELTIESRQGEGAAFTISLPRHARMVRQLEAGSPAGKE